MWISHGPRRKVSFTNATGPFSKRKAFEAASASAGGPGQHPTHLRPNLCFFFFVLIILSAQSTRKKRTRRSRTSLTNCWKKLKNVKSNCLLNFCFTNPSLNIFISFKFSRIKWKFNEKNFNCRNYLSKFVWWNDVIF